jgi:hypothetical protein
MERITKDLVKQLLATDQIPCLSLYMPAHRSHPENQQDPIRFRNLVKQLEESLLLKYSSGEAHKLLEPFEALADDKDFWNHTSEGLGMFSATGFFKTVALPIAVAELAVVADSFHTKPLRQYLQSTDRYHVLGLSLHDIHLYEGNQHSLVEVDLHADITQTREELTGDDDAKEKHLTVASYGGTGGVSSSMHHGHGGYKEEVDKDTERFFRAVAGEIAESYSKPTGWPLILAALPEHHSLFKRVNKNPMLLPDGITLNPDTLTNKKLIDKAWEIMEPEYLQKLDNLAGRFMQAKANGKGSDDYKEIAVAAVEGRVETLIIESDRIIAVRITNLVTGNTQKKDIENPKVDDLLDDMGELVTKMGGQVMVFPPDKMPTKTGMAAIFHY